MIDYESFYNLEKNFFTNLSDISYAYNCHDNIDYELKSNNVKENNYESYDFDNEGIVRQLDISGLMVTISLSHPLLYKLMHLEINITRVKKENVG